MAVKTRKTRAVEHLASALMECMDASAEEGEKRAQRAAEKTIARVEARMNQRLDQMDARLDRQDDTLRLMWKQMKGNGKLPIDAPPP